MPEGFFCQTSGIILEVVTQCLTTSKLQKESPKTLDPHKRSVLTSLEPQICV